MAYIGVSVISGLASKVGKLMPPDSTETAAAILRLRDELISLRERHAERLTRAAYVGMTPGEANEHDKRRDKIRAIIQQLAVLQNVE